MGGCLIRSAANRSYRIHVAEAIFTVRGNIEEGSHVEEKDEEVKDEDLKRASLTLGLCYQELRISSSDYAKRLNEVRPLCFSTICCCQVHSATSFRPRE